MRIKNNPIENETFHHYRITQQVTKIKKAIETLVSFNFKVIDLENQIIDKHNINDFELRKTIDYNRTRKKAIYQNQEQ